MKNIMDELATLINTEIPEGHQSLGDSHTNLERVADYCEDTYHRSDNKKDALDATKNYTTQSLASVAYQINTLAYNYIQLMDLQAQQLSEMQSQMNHIAQTIMIHKEKIARREIGILTGNKYNARQYKIVAPKNPEKPIKYVRKPIDYMILDHIGHGVSNPTGIRPQNAKELYRTPSQSSSSATGIAKNTQLGPPPATKPPTPPQSTRTAGNTGTLNKSISKTGTLGKSSSREYRTPAVVTTPQVPSHYAPNYPMGHRKRISIGSDQGGGGGGSGSGSSVYSILPMPPSQQIATHVNLPSAGMMQNYPPPPPISSYDDDDERNNMPDPPPPLTTGVSHNLVDDQNHFGMHTLGRNINNINFMRSGSQSPPLPPPPQSDDEHHDFGRPRNQAKLTPIIQDDQSLPDWVPKDYIEKVIAIYDYYAEKDDELSFQESAVLYVLKKNDDGWWEGAMDGVTGLFPGNYVEPCV